MSTEVIPAVSGELAKLENVIASGLATFVDVGRALGDVRDLGLYREAGFDTFEAYARGRWELTRSRAYQMMDGARVAEAVSTNVDTARPATEAVARELVPLLSEGDETVAEAWGRVLAQDERPTAKAARSILVAEGYLPNTRANVTRATNRVELHGRVGDKIAAARAQLERFINDELGDTSLGPNGRAQAERYLGWLRAMADIEAELVAGRQPATGDELRTRLDAGHRPLSLT